MNDKWKSLIELVVNEEEDKAKELFHEIAVDESRKIYENLIDEEDLADIDEASEETKEEAVEEATDETIEEAEQTEESKSEEVEESEECHQESFGGGTGGVSRAATEAFLLWGGSPEQHAIYHGRRDT